MLRFLLGIAVGWAAASVMQDKSRSPGGSRAAGGRVDELSAAQDDPSFGIGPLNAGDGTPSASKSTGIGASTRHGMEGDDLADVARARTASAQTSDTFNGA